MSETLEITERRIAQVVRDLSDAGMVAVQRVGRRNFYTVNADASFRHPTLAHITLGKFVEILQAPGTTQTAAGEQ
jgi:hypothetical protein